MKDLFYAAIEQTINDYEKALSTLLKMGVVKKPERTVKSINDEGKVTYIPIKNERPEYKKEKELYKKYRDALDTKLECEAFLKEEMSNYEIESAVHGDRIIREIRNRVFEKYEEDIAKVDKEKVYNEFLDKFEKNVIKDIMHERASK